MDIYHPMMAQALMRLPRAVCKPARQGGMEDDVGKGDEETKARPSGLTWPQVGGLVATIAAALGIWSAVTSPQREQAAADARRDERIAGMAERVGALEKRADQSEERTSAALNTMSRDIGAVRTQNAQVIGTLNQVLERLGRR